MVPMLGIGIKALRVWGAERPVGCAILGPFGSLVVTCIIEVCVLEILCSGSIRPGEVRPGEARFEEFRLDKDRFDETKAELVGGNDYGSIRSEARLCSTFAGLFRTEAYTRHQA